MPEVGNTADTQIFFGPWGPPNFLLIRVETQGIWCIGSIAYFRHLTVDLFTIISISRVLRGSTTIITTSFEYLPRLHYLNYRPAPVLAS